MLKTVDSYILIFTKKAIKKRLSGAAQKPCKIEITLDRMHLSPASAKGYFSDILKSNIFQPLFLLIPKPSYHYQTSSVFCFQFRTSSNSLFQNFLSAEGHSIPFLKTLLYEFSSFHLYIGIILSVI